MTEVPIGRLLSIIAKSYLSALNSTLRDLDIDRNYYALLLIEKGNGELTQQELALQLEVDKVTMLRSIDYLSDKNYIQRIKNNNDRRKFNLVLTEKAISALSNIKMAISALNDSALSGLDEKQKEDFYQLLFTIKMNLNQYCSTHEKL